LLNLKLYECHYFKLLQCHGALSLQPVLFKIKATSYDC
jgi:hypothetical protein